MTRLVIIAQAVLIAFECVGVTQAEDPRRAHFWVEVADNIITPGESIDITMWMEFEPKAPTVIFYAGKDRVIAGFGHIWGPFNLLVVPENGKGGSWSNVVFNPAFSPLSEVGGETPNMLWSIRIDNFLPYELPSATKDNPLLMLKATWTPESYATTKVHIEPDTPGALKIAAYTPPDMTYPWLPVTYTTNDTPIVITIQSKACPPDCDDSGQLDIDDFICFQTLYAIGC